MTMVKTTGKTVRNVAFVLAVLVLGVLPAFSQTSIGFEDPDDTTNLLEYRLPDWGWRTWDLTFDFHGGGYEAYREDDDQGFSNDVSTILGSQFDLYRESERREWSTSALVEGGYQRSHQGTSLAETSGHTLNTALVANGNLREYLGGGPLFLAVGGFLNTRYSEQIYDQSGPFGDSEDRDFRRTNSLEGSAGFGLGRIRDVTPLIRAQRLSERLVALGRRPLTRDQVQKVARSLATEEGYRMVFDRPEKSFWRDVLEPMLDPDNPLAPYELFYLRDVMDEDIGPRTEGALIQVDAAYNENSSSNGNFDSLALKRSVGVYASWDHNLSLNHQLRAYGGLRFYNWSAETRKDENVSGQLGLVDLWTIADRYRWDNSLYFTSDNRTTSSSVSQWDQRNLVTRLSSAFRVFVENRMAIVASVRGDNRQEYLESVDPGDNETYRRAWSWSYGIGLEYRLDSFLY